MSYKKSLKIIKNRLLEKEKSQKKIRYYGDVPPLDMEHLERLDNCLCTDSKHQFKEIYISEHEAENQAKYLKDMMGVTISVYPCPYSEGWHLTQR